MLEDLKKFRAMVQSDLAKWRGFVDEAALDERIYFLELEERGDGKEAKASSCEG